MNEDLLALQPYALRILYRVNEVPRVAAVPIDPVGRGAGFVRGENDDLAWSVRLVRDETSLVVEPAVTARRLGVRLDAIEPLRALGTGDAGDVRAVHNGWQSWSAFLGLGPDAVEPRPRWRFLDRITASPSAPPLGARGEVSSELCTALVHAASGRAVVAGFVRAASQFGAFTVHLRRGETPRLVARLPFEGVPMLPDETRTGEPLVVLAGDLVTELLELWAKRLARASGARVPDRAVAGWCSWYEHFERIAEEVIARNLEQAAALRERLGLELFQVDDGYQAAIGDWLEPARRRFPRGVAAFVPRIVEAGLTPGLWLAPFLAARRSRVAREHPDWLLRDRAGRVVPAVYNPRWSLVSTAAALDPTHPGVQEWIARVCATLVREWGFRFLKLDFLYAAALPGARHDPRTTGAEALRAGLETIRRAVGDEVRLLGCGCPLGPAIGVVDLMRIGPDVAPYWTDRLASGPGRDVGLPATRNAVRNSIGRAFLHGALWGNDPDCLLVRRRRTRLGEEEVRTLAATVALAGGSVLLSDDLAELAPDRLAVAERVLAIHRELAPGARRCLDPATPGFPRLLLAARRDGGFYLAIVNPGDEPRATSFRVADLALPRPAPRALTLRDAWSGAEVVAPSGVVDLGVLRPHESRLLLALPATAGAQGRA